MHYEISNFIGENFLIFAGFLCSKAEQKLFLYDFNLYCKLSLKEQISEVKTVHSSFNCVNDCIH